MPYQNINFEVVLSTKFKEVLFNKMVKLKLALITRYSKI